MNPKHRHAGFGRPRAFDEGQALDRAMQIFWRKGYEGASLADLTKAMGINRPSLYNAFGDKEALFRKVLDRYERGPARYVVEALRQPTARAAVESLFRAVCDAADNSANPRGCLFVHGALACGSEAECVRQDLISRRAAGETGLRRRFQRAKSDGDLPRRVDAAGLARYIMAVLHGMAVRSASGASRKELQGIAEMAMRAWPTSS
jgi:AcrR family transcriptional regulator